MPLKKIFTLLLAVLLISTAAYADLKVSSLGTGKGVIHKLDTAAGLTITTSGGTGTITASLRTGTDAIASGQTSKAVTISGVTTASKCVATGNEVATNSVSIRAAVPTTDTVTVHSSGDPGASNLDISVICVGP